MNWRMISTLVYNDVALFFRNRLFAPVTMLMLVSFTAIYFLMPGSVDETFRVGLYAPKTSPFFIELMEEEGLIIQKMASENALKHAMVEGQYNVGIVLPGSLMEELKAGINSRIYSFLSGSFYVCGA